MKTKLSKKKIIETRRYHYHGIFRGEVPFYYSANRTWLTTRDYAAKYDDGLWVKIVAFFVGGMVVDL